MSNYRNTALMKDMGMTKEQIDQHYRTEQRKNAYDTHGQNRKPSKKKSVGAKRRQMKDDSAAFARMLKSGNYDEY